jgi:hypothetical protein
VWRQEGWVVRPWGKRAHTQSALEGAVVATTRGRGGGGIAGISTGGIIVIVGVVLMLIWSFWIGLIITLVGLLAFGGFARGRWY